MSSGRGTTQRRQAEPKDGGDETEDANVRVQGEEELDAGGEDFGVRLEPFNLKEERKHGRFDKDGFFVRNANDEDDDEDDEEDSGARHAHKKMSRRQQARARKMALITRDDDRTNDDDEEEDEWVDDVCRTYSRALRGESAEAAAARQRAWEEEQAAERTRDEQERRARGDRALQASMLRTLAGLLAADDETVLDALRRLGRAKRAGTAGAAADLDRLAKVADDLLTLGFADVYTASRRAVLRLAGSGPGVRRGREAGDAQDAADAADAAAAKRARGNATAGGAAEGDGSGAALVWEYVLDSEEPQVVHGPFSTAAMAQWRRCGFFVGAFRARVRKVPAGATPEQRSAVPFVPSENVTFE